jgi:putative flippase GtrA
MRGSLGQSLRFGAVGLVNTAIGLSAIYALMFLFDTAPALANAAGYAIGLAIGFALNRAWTFRSERPLGAVLPRYLLVVAISYLMNLGVVIVSTSHFSVNPYVAQLFGIVVYTVSTFFGCRSFVFGARHAA